MSAPPAKPQKPPKPPKPAGGSPSLPSSNANFPPLPETPQSPPVGKSVANRSIPPRKPRPVSVRDLPSLPSPPVAALSRDQGKPANGAPPALPPKPTPPPKPPSVAEAPAALPSRPMPPIPQNQLSAPEIRPEMRKSGESVQFAVTPPEKRVSVNADLEKHLTARLRNSGGLGAPPAPPPPPEPEEKPSPKSSASKLLRPKKTTSSKRASTKASAVFGTLPRLMGNKDGSKDKVIANDSKDSAPPALESPRGSHGSPEITHVLPPIEAPSAPAESNVKWKRGAEAEAILKLLAEQAGAGTKDPVPGNTPAVGSGSGDNISTAAPRIDFLDTSEIMKILGIEEGGIKLPEKQRDGEEKALDPVTELQLTERNFIADLGLLMQTFTKPVRDKDLLPLPVIESMELNLDRLICLHRELYQQILADSTVAGITRSFSDELIRELERLYTVYMGHYEGAIQVFYDKRDNVANFRKFLKQREQMTDKSIPNLLVTPVQRVCKYELMLASIHKSLRKQTPPPTDDQHFNLLNTRITQLNTALQNVDHRRAAADNWEKVHQLEKSLTFSEPLAKPDRRLILEADSLIRVGDQEHVFKLVLFNDILLRAKISKRNKKGNVLDCIPLHELLWVDVTREQSADSTPSVGAPRHSFLLTSSNPRGDIWTVHTSSEADKVQWLSHLAELALPYAQFCHQWNVLANGSLLGIDKGRWPQEYVNDVRLFLTSTHLCVLWKMFGSFEREKIALDEIQSVQSSPKDRSLTLKVSNWKRNYTFVDLQNLVHTEATLNLARQSAKSNATNSPILQPVKSDNFSLSTSEWDRVWSNASSRVYQPSTVLQAAAPTLYKLLRGTVSVKKSPTEDLPILPGSVFGVSSFLSSQSRFPVVCSSEVHLLEIERDKVFTLFDGLELARFFASLALCTSLV